MAHVTFTTHLARFFPALDAVEVDAADVRALLAVLETQHTGLAAYLVDEHGALRKHVNVFVDGRPLRDRRHLSDPLAPTSKVFVAQALSGG